MEHIINTMVGFIWNWPVTGLCLFGCIFFTLILKFIQLRCFPHAIELISGKYDNPNEKGQITHFQALTAALSATIGLGNIAGVAIAIAIAGPGSVFWMWVIGFFGMATKYCECALGTHYRDIDSSGNAHGGPMYYITKGLGKKFKPFSVFYAIAISIAAFGAGCLFQSNQAAAALNQYYNVPTLTTGIVLFCLTALVIIGGITRIGKVTSKIVPFMCIIYISCAIIICLLNIGSLPTALGIIIKDAFTGYAVAGGIVPVIFAGIRRAIFSNEAGLGSAAIAHAAVKTDYPIREGIVASLGPFIDTIVVCTATAMVIILSGNYGSEMYKQADSYNFSFENKNYTQNLKGNWQAVDKNSAPQASDPFRSFVEDTTVLSYKNSNQPQQPITFFNIPNPTQTIKFSYFKQTGDMQVNIYSQDNTLLGTLDSIDQFADNNLTIQYFNTSNEWQSAVINIDDPTVTSISLQFIPIGTSSTWYFDAIKPVSKISGIALTTTSFDHFFKGFGSIFITFSVLFFAFSTMISWSYYGETALYYLFGNKLSMIYKITFSFLIIVGATQSMDLIVNFSDAMIGLLVIPNMIAIVFLSPKVKDWTISYFKDLKAGKIKPYSA